MVDRISSLDSGYQTGDLSIYPEALDDKDVLYEATNNSETTLRQTLSYNGKVVIVDDTTGFPDTGQIRVGLRDATGISGTDGQNSWELIAYAKRTRNTFEDLERGFAGSKQNYWPAEKTVVANPVGAEPHNSTKDAIINIETNLGVDESPEAASLNGILKTQEVRFLAPKPLFRALPIKGPAPLKVRFQNFVTGHVVRVLWDFGDGGTSLERSPTHTYIAEGEYTVKLNVVTSTGAQGVASKVSYITVDNDESIPFFYVDSLSDPYSVKTADELTNSGTPTDPKEFVFIDQTDGDVVQRNWVFGDGEALAVNDPDIHEISHIYQEPGEYLVTLLVVLANGRLKRVVLPSELMVL
jgi:PKD repeat protein